MRRLVVILAVAAIMVATMLGTALTASAQTVGQPTCGPWQQARYVSALGWPYYWNWRWCINRTVAPEYQHWYVDWAGWHWG